MSCKPNIMDLTKAKLEEAVTAMGEPGYRADQVFSWLYQKRASSFHAMTNLSKAFREKLDADYSIGVFSDVKSVVSRAAKKYCMTLLDGNTIECVVLSHTSWNTVCLSTQAGCMFGCSFCASGMRGLRRNLRLSEMVGQLIHAQEDAGDIKNVVFMGVGEPFDNYETLIEVIDIINDPKGFNIGARKMTVSTCGPKGGITRFAELGKQVELSVSLHGARDGVRGKLMPVNKANPLKALMAECRYYIQQTGRIITFEYVMIRGENDLPQDVEELAALLNGLKCRINLIVYNPVKGLPYESSSIHRVHEFRQFLQASGFNVTVRHLKGADIDAACGQLRIT